MDYKRLDKNTVEIIPDKVPVRKVINEIARLSYELARPVGLGFLQPSLTSSRDTEFSDYINLDGNLDGPWVLEMDYVNGRQCKTYIRKDEQGRLLLDASVYETDRGSVEGLLDKVKEKFNGGTKSVTVTSKNTPFSKELAIDTLEMKEKLTHLSKYMEDQSGSFLQGMDSTVFEFSRLLSERLNPQIVPAGFIMGAELLLYDLRRGVNGFTMEPIKSPLVGMPDTVYDGLRLYIPKIANAVAPSEFAKEVKKEQEEILSEIQYKT